MNILILEDDAAVLQFVSVSLTNAGFQVTECQDIPAAKSLINSQQFDCLVLDRSLPSGDALSFIQSIVEQGKPIPPVLFLTALDSIEERIAGLAHADDYLIKPFAIDELIARIKALLRRNLTSGLELEGAGIVLNRIERWVTRYNQKIELNPMEFKLLEYLLTNKNQTVSRQMLLQHVWEYNFEPATSIVETYISRLRNKLEVTDKAPSIVTIRGAGYSIADC